MLSFWFFKFLCLETSPDDMNKNKGYCTMMSNYRLWTLLISVPQEVLEHRYSCLFFLIDPWQMHSLGSLVLLHNFLSKLIFKWWKIHFDISPPPPTSPSLMKCPFQDFSYFLKKKTLKNTMKFFSLWIWSSVFLGVVVLTSCTLVFLCIFILQLDSLLSWTVWAGLYLSIHYHLYFQ